MKIMSTLAVCLTTLMVWGAEPMAELLQKGLFEEEANQNFPEAIKAYESLIQQGEEQRKLFATAIFRLGECYRKLGKTNEATAQYQRVLREFADNTRLADLSRQYLGGASQPGKTNIVGFAREEELAELKKKIASNPDYVNERAQNGNGTPLHQAAMVGNVKMVELLLQSGAGVDATNNDQDTPLHIAAYQGHSAVVAMLINAKAKVDAVNKNRETALHHAASRGFIDIVELLMGMNANINAKSAKGMPIHYAARLGKKFMLQTLLNHGADVEARDNGDETPLHHACGQEGDLETIRLLLNKKANVNSTNRNGETPLHLAVKVARSDIIEELMKRGANVNATTQGGHTPLAVGWLWSGRQNVEPLLAKGADPNSRLPGGYPYDDPMANLGVRRHARDVTLLIAAVLQNSREHIEMLLRHGADPNLTDGLGNTALYYAISLRRFETAELLLANKADPNPKEGSLLPAAIADPKMVSLLLKHKADPNVQNTANQLETPLHTAVAQGQAEVVAMLLDAGANIGTTDINGWTPLDRAKSLNNSLKTRIIQTLRDRGANEFLPRPGIITLVRVQRDWVIPFFFADTNQVNQHTLYEALAAAFAGSQFPFPDLKNIRRSRGKEILSIDLEEAFRTGDCSKDQPLAWGDVIEIPEADHNENANWALPKDLRESLTTCTERKVALVVKGKTNMITLQPSFADAQPPRRIIQATQPGVAVRTESESPLTIREFRLYGIVRNSNLLRISSDLSRVEVHRNINGKPAQWVFDLTAPSYDVRRDFWLRNGDVIIIPDKGEVQAKN